jgi:hypothetical protein
MVAALSLKPSVSKGEQKPEALGGGPNSVPQSSVNGGTPEQAGPTSKLTFTSEEALESNPSI